MFECEFPVLCTLSRWEEYYDDAYKIVIKAFIKSSDAIIDSTVEYQNEFWNIDQIHTITAKDEI